MKKTKIFVCLILSIIVLNGCIYVPEEQTENTDLQEQVEEQEENKEEQDTNTIVTKPEPQHYRFSFKQFLSDLKSLFQGNMSWKEFRKKYCSELRFMCMGIVVGLLIGWCF